MSKVYWLHPEFPEAGGCIHDFQNNIYCEWDADIAKQKLSVSLPLQGKSTKISLMPYIVEAKSHKEQKNLFVQLAKNYADNCYSLSQLHDDLGHVPDKAEVNRLIGSYPSFYLKPYRKDFLYSLLSGISHAEMVANKLTYDGDKPTAGPKGKAVVWTRKKAKKMALRLLYLKFVEDEGQERGEAIDILMDDYIHLTNATTRRNNEIATQRPCDK